MARRRASARQKPVRRGRSSAVWLAWLYFGLIVYASLYPFAAWRAPGVSPFAFIWQIWSPYWTAFDLASNFFGYLPFGALLFIAWVRSGGGTKSAVLWAVAVGSAVSLGMEFTQNWLPQRVASNVDWGLNSAGALAGAGIGAAWQRAGGVMRWQEWRERWFIDGHAGSLALLVLWPVALLFPPPAPLALGQIWPPLQQALEALAEGTPALNFLIPWIAAVNEDPLSPLGEFAATALGLLAPCLLAYSVARNAWYRLGLALGAITLGLAATSLSTALNFGPQHAWAWATPLSLAAVGTAAVLATLTAPLGRSAAAALGLVVLTALVVVVAQAPLDAYRAASLQAWEQGRFIRFHGAAQWVGWLWPYAALVLLFARLAVEPRGASSPPKIGR